MHEVHGPDVVGISRPQADDRGIVMLEPPALLVPLRQLKPFAALDLLDPLSVYHSAFTAQQCCDPAIAITAILLGQPDDR